MNYNERLLQLKKRVLQKKIVETKLKELEFQREELDRKVQEFKRVMWEEQADVDRLERTSLTSLFYTIIGKKEDMLDKGKVKAYAAKVKYDSAVEEMNLVEEDICRMEAQLREIPGCQREYEALLQEKEAAIKASGSADAERILQLEKQITAQKSHRKEIGEALSSGSRVLNLANSTLSSLDSAEGCDTWNPSGYGLISDLEKHSHLDEAQDKVQKLQSESDMQLKLDGCPCSADHFFDVLFAGLSVQDKISLSNPWVQHTKSQIESVLFRLRTMNTSVEHTIKKLEAEKNSIVLKALL